MNSSAVNLQIVLQSLQLSYLTLVLFVCGFLLVLVILGAIANVTVCNVLVRGGRFKKHLSNFMLFHLSLTDMVYRLVVVPGHIAAKYSPAESKSVILCKFAETCLDTVYTAVFTSLVVIAFDRHQSITKPFQRLRSKPKFLRWILVVWGYSIVCALPQMFNDGIGTLTFDLTNFTKDQNLTFVFQICSVTKEDSSQRVAAVVYFILGFLVPLVLITIAYSKIALFLWRKSRDRMVNQAALKSKTKALQMLILLVLGFVICLGTPQVKKLLDSFGVLRHTVAFVIVVLILRLSSSLVNPIIYGLYSAEFKQGLKNRK